MDKKQVILFGASNMGEEAYSLLKDRYDIVNFCDNDEKKWGKKFCNTPIISPDDLKLSKYKDIEIIITSTYNIEISQQLRNMNLKNFKSLQSEIQSYKKKENFDIGIKEEFKGIVKNLKKLDNKENNENSQSDECKTKNKDTKLNVACILDEFSYSAFKDECNLINLNPDNWKDVLQKDVDFLFVESAWNGNNGAWSNMLSLLNDSEHSNNKILGMFDNILNDCEQLNIPTVFWNKEDPVHYDKFILLAKRFQYIFTTDENIIHKYVLETGHERVYSLPFAANINIHNPIDSNEEKIGNIAFAGSWYSYHEKRKIDMEKILLPALDLGTHIYDRNYGMEINEKFKFPEEYTKNIVGKLEYDDMVKFYKRYNILLNVNTVQDSPTMFSRRVFEFLACGTNVISGYSLGIEEMFGDIVLMSSSSEETKQHIRELTYNTNTREKLSIQGIRRIIEMHSYTHRFNYIVDKLKISNTKELDKGVSIISILTDYKQMKNIIDNYNQQKFSNKELIIVIKSNNIERSQIVDSLIDFKNIFIYKVRDNEDLSQCFNYGISKSKKDYVALFDEYDYYGEHYLKDLINSFKYSKAGVVGKASIFEYIMNTSQMTINSKNKEHSYSQKLFGTTLVIDKNIFLKGILFNKSENIYEQFLNDCKEKNIKIYSSDKYNYIKFKKYSNKTIPEKDTHCLNIKESMEYVNI